MGYNLYWGDSHTNIRTHQMDLLEKSMEHANQVLDFFPIAYYPFYVYDQQGLQVETCTDREIFHKQWEKVADVISRYNSPGEFVTFLGYEWHGDRRYYGDHNVIYFNDYEPLVDFKSLEELYDHLRQHKGIAIPHHVAYLVRERGKDWDVFDEELSPIVEMYSMHGSSEGCNTPFTMSRNQSMGPRLYEGSIHAGLERGHKFGLIASGDNHMGVPGYWGNGLMAVYARDLSREGIWEALKARRTYAVTGDRIKLKFSLEDKVFMGENIDAKPPYKFRVSAEGSDIIDRIDLIKNNRVVDSYVHKDREYKGQNVRMKLRLEFGFGPEPYFETRWNDWKGNIKISEGQIIDLESAFTWLDQQVSKVNDKEYGWNLKTKAREYSQQLIFTIEAPMDAEIKVYCNGKEEILTVKEALKYPKIIPYVEQAKKTIKREFGLSPDEIENPDHFYHHAFKLKIHRAIPEEDYIIEHEFIDKKTEGENWYYVRVYQRNGQMAWSSPIWINSRKVL